MPPIAAGQSFATLHDFKAALRIWAIEKNFTPHIRDSDANRVRAGCRSQPDCPFRIRANYKNGLARVSTCHDVHTCRSAGGGGGGGGGRAPLAIKRAEISKVKFLLQVVPQLLHVAADTPTQAIIDAVRAKYGQEIALRQAQKVKSALCPPAREACRVCGAATHCNPASRKLEPCPRDPRGGGMAAAEQPAGVAAGPDDETGGAGDADMATGFDEEPARAFPGTADVAQPNGQGQSQSYGRLAPTEPTAAAHPSSSGGSTSNAAPDASGTGDRMLGPGTAYTAHASVYTHAQPTPMGPPGGLRPGHGRAGHGVGVGIGVGVGVGHHAGGSAGLGNTAAAEAGVPVAAKTPQETRMEAARLMQNAARMMQEAARMNAEAARLIASVANA
jgi:hypothetical protein